MSRWIAVIIVAISLCLAARPAVAEEAFDSRASSVWWAQVTGDDAPETQFHLLPDNTLGHRDWVGLARDTAFLLGYQIVGAGRSRLPLAFSNCGPAATILPNPRRLP